jgi:LysM repeat protein
MTQLFPPAVFNWQDTGLVVNSSMRWRFILGLSLLLNLGLGLSWWRSGGSRSVEPADSTSLTNAAGATNVRTAVIVRRQFFSWQELESRDYPTYIKNLRQIGCPEPTIRDIIIADVSQMLRARYDLPDNAELLLKPSPKWWTNQRDTTAQEKLFNQMLAERNSILTELLGADWAASDPAKAATGDRYVNLILATMELDPLLKTVPTAEKQAFAKLFGGMIPPRVFIPEPFLPEDAQAERDLWAQARTLLTPEQWERAKLHFAIHAESLRNQLDAVPGFNTQPEEFRKLFLATEAVDEQLALLYAQDDEPATVETIKRLTAQREAAIRGALTPARYELLVRLQDPAYLRAMETLAGGGDPKALNLLYAINRETSAEEARIQDNEQLTETQREIELKKLDLEKLKAVALALGEEIAEDAPADRPKPEPVKVHNVKPGEGLDRIARLYGVRPEDLQAANPNLNFNQLPTGANVNIPLRLMYPLPPPVAQ